ncbi:hypothetical protein E1176_15095 [Fulvivirga sp. RKSG066]|uniref:sulfotransferase n=1 Tax=Fulvivirga aurantia TaxID=2529383 RepID=UPI0012BCE242|nr:sulfotransferase [Fulvivirga aurantia]MTI22357.1 hypothetical protein [Fulvivirga aurantia]
MSTSRSEEFTKFAIVCAPRSGSTMLHTYLNSHSAILSHGEIIRRKVEAEEELLSIDEFAFSPQSKKIKAVGLKLFYEYMYKDKFKVAFDEVVEDKTIKIIHLTRDDKKKQLTSLRRAEKSGAWSSVLKSTEEPIKIILSEEDLSSYEKEQKEMIDIIHEKFKEHTVLQMTYENLVSDPKAELDKIQQFINVEPQQLFTLLQKQGAE